MQIDTAQSGKQALEKTLTTEYQIIFLDHLMPEMDGIECLHAIRSQVGGLSRESKMVVLTANADSESKAMYVKEGFDGYLVKPTGGEILEKECMRLLPKDMVHTIYADDSIVEESMSWLKEHERKEEVLISTPWLIFHRTFLTNTIFPSSDISLLQKMAYLPMVRK